MPTRPWRVHGVRVLHDDVVRIEEHDVETPEGRRFAYPLVRSTGFAMVVPVTDGGDVVLVRQYRHALGGPTLELPAGAVDAGETAAAAARRELAEEAGLAAGALVPLGTFVPSPGRLDARGALFLATACVEDPGAVPAEPTEAVRLPLAAALAAIGGEIVDAVSALALLLARDRLGPRAAQS
jgi:ADP-ribose pyrophosphatase